MEGSDICSHGLWVLVLLEVVAARTLGGAEYKRKSKKYGLVVVSGASRSGCFSCHSDHRCNIGLVAVRQV
jgi:hypothetical protein